MSRLQTVLAAIDTANAADPRMDEGQPECLLYGQRMSEELDRLYPAADDLLQIAARGQHIERWTRPRADYPEGRTGYLTWRRDLGAFHADRVGELMADAGYEAEAIQTAKAMLRKEGIKRNPDVQKLENVICFVFVKWYFAPFAAKYSGEKILRIVEKTARKMSADARERMLAEFDLPDDLAAAFRV